VTGRKRNGGSGVDNGNKQTFVQGVCQRQPSTRMDLRRISNRVISIAQESQARIASSPEDITYNPTAGLMKLRKVEFSEVLKSSVPGRL
jgi:hypothetical protein